jgi:hypothetical protein
MAGNIQSATVAVLFVLLASGFASAAYIHMASFRTDVSPKPGQDFTLFVTFKNDFENSVDNAQVRLLCPAGLSCPNLTATFPSYGVQELAFPIKSNATAGLYSITAVWDDGSLRYNYDPATGSTAGVSKLFSATIPIDVREHSLSAVSAEPVLYANENGSYWIAFDAKNLNSVQVSLYSDCISFATPLFHYDRLDFATTASTAALVNCRSGNSEIIFTLQSDEVSYSVPLTVKIEKRPHARILVVPESSVQTVGKSFYRINVTNDASTAEKLTLSVISSPAADAVDVAYLGDFTGTREVVFEIESDHEGTYPLSIEAKWAENREQFSQVFENPVTLQAKWDWWLLAAVLAAVALAAWLIRK